MVLRRREEEADPETTTSVLHLEALNTRLHATRRVASGRGLWPQDTPYRSSRCCGQNPRFRIDITRGRAALIPLVKSFLKRGLRPLNKPPEPHPWVIAYRWSLIFDVILVLMAKTALAGSKPNIGCCVLR